MACLLSSQLLLSVHQPPSGVAFDGRFHIGLAIKLIWVFLSDILATIRVSVIAQLVKNPPAMRETWVQSLGWEDPLEKGKVTHSSILAWKNSMDCIVHGVTKIRT